MDPLSITSGALGTFGVVLQSAQALIQLIGDVRDAPEEIGAASKEVESFTGVLKNIQDQVDNGTIPKEIAETLKLPLSNCTSEITNLTNKLRPYITGSGSGRKWTNRLKWAMVEKQFVKGVAERLSQNKLTLLTGISGYTVANTGKQLGELNSQISKLEDASLDRHKAEIGNTKYIADGVRELDNRVIMVSEETKERDMRLAAEAKAHSEQLAAAMAAQLEAQMSALLATQFAKLEQNFVGANAPQNTQEEQIVASKTDQIRDLIVKVKDDPVFALRNFFEGSTVIEGNTAKASDIADLATLEDDYMIDDEADDVGNSGLSIEERIESYGGWAHPTESLFSAVMAGDKQVVVALLEAGVDVDAINKNGKTALMLAADDDQKLIARKLLEKGANIDSVDADGSTALHMACNRGYVTICVLFLRNGADIEAKNLKLETPLQIAVLANRPHIVQSLVEHNCDLKAIGPAGFSILHLIIEKGYLGMQRILLDGGANVDIRDPTTGRTPLQIASLLGKSSFVTMLLEHGASPNLVDDKLDTAFLVAAREGKQDILKLLANGGADVNMKSAKGNSALHEAAGRLRSEEVIETLLELPNLEINQKNSDHLTPFLTAITVTNIPALKLLMKVSDTSATNEQKFGPLHLAAQKSTLEVVQILIEHGLDLYALDIYKMPPFHRAVRCSNVPVLEHFLKLGADVNAISGDAPWTSLHHACHSANVATVKSLLSHGAKTETIVPNDVSATAFLRAVRNGKLDIVRFLLDNGANIAPETHLGYTALHLCAWKSQPKICSLLLERGGIDIEARDNQGMTPLLRAANTPGSEEVALLLIKKGANREAKANTDENALRLFLRSNGKSVELFNALLEKEVDISAVDNYKLSPLIRAVVSGQLSIVSAILAKNPNLESTNSSQMTSLNIAAWKGFKEIVVLLLNAGANINHRDINGISSLIHAAKCGQEEIVTLLIARGADVYAKNNKAQNTLDVAIEAKKTTLAAMLMNMEAFQKSSSTIQQAVGDNNVPLIELLLMKKPELIEEKDQYGYTPLHLSLLDPAKNAAFTFLLEKGSDLEGRITSGETPLMISAWKNHKDGALKLIEKSKFQSGGKCPLIFQTGTKGWTPLHYATRWNTDTYIIKLLLSNGAEVDAVDENEVTALHQAADQGRLEAIRILVAAGANIDAKDKWGQTPIMRAIKGKHISTSQLFVELGASVQEKTYQYSMSALLFAVSWTDSVPLVETLLTAGATINDDLDNEECNPLTRAAVTGNRAVFEFLLTKGGRPDAIDVFGQQPLQRATRITSEKGVRILLDAGADVNFKEEKWGMTALHYAASTNSTSEIAQLLLDHGADINSKDVSGTTPIFKAAFQAKIVLLKFLVEKGADLEARNNEGLTPLLQMVKSGRRDMVSLLLEQGADITAKESKLGLSIAHIAAVSNSQALIMEDLLKRGVPLEGKDNNGNTPLLRAAIAGREAVIRCLLAKGANLEALNTVSPLTPVLHAICNRQVAAALFLLKHGVNHNATNNTGWHGVHMAASNGVALALNFYIEHGYTELEISDASPASSRGLRALHIAVREGHDECVKILLASGAGVEFKTFSNKYTPFLFVAEPRYTTPQKTTSTMLAIAKKLVAAKADIFVKDRNGRNALFGASRLGAIELMEFLVEKGLQLDVKDLSDNTLIHVTTENDQKKTLEYLIKNGVDVCVSNNKGITPLHIAVSKYNCAIVKILVGANANAVDMNDKAGKTPFDEAVRLAAQYDGPEELRPKTTAIPQMSREKARQNIKDIVALFHNIRGTKDIAPIITTISRRATEPIIRGL